MEAISESGASRPDATIDPALFRATLSQFATGVTVVTAMVDGTPMGVAANAFTSVSLDPPLILVCAGKTSDTWPHIRRSGVFAVNVLAHDQETLCRVFATKGAPRFDAVDYTAGVSGVPLLAANSLVSLECAIDNELEAGDHVVILGRVIALHSHRRGKPLVFFESAYTSIRPAQGRARS
jgi:3-hydroxy-9,10-secoandrosta-1,3,5(10)-triene-9,17-dione monooxygenase reductase component